MEKIMVMFVMVSLVVCLISLMINIWVWTIEDIRKDRHNRKLEMLKAENRHSEV